MRAAKNHNTVALRKESVDRNLCPAVIHHCHALSLSARRAWIEIDNPLEYICYFLVALRKESVDRNSDTATRIYMVAGRSPQGERG